LNEECGVLAASGGLWEVDIGNSALTKVSRVLRGWKRERTS
jgi:hypothetical protein